MKNFGLILLGVFLCLSINAFDLQAQNKDKKKKMEEVTFLTNLHCENCKKKIEKNISWEKGVKDLHVDLDDKKVTILYDPAKTNPEKLQAAIEKLGYTCEIVKSKEEEVSDSTPLLRAERSNLVFVKRLLL